MIRYVIRKLLKEQKEKPADAQKVAQALTVKANEMQGSGTIQDFDIRVSGNSISIWWEFGDDEDPFPWRAEKEKKIRITLSGHEYGWELKRWSHGRMTLMNPEKDPDICYPEDLGQWVYHVSDAKNKENILSQGLTPRTSDLGWKGRIYMTDTIEGIISVIQDLSGERKAHSFSVFFKISTADILDSRLHIDFEFMEGCEYFWTSDAIPPRAIKDVFDYEHDPSERFPGSKEIGAKLSGFSGGGDKHRNRFGHY